MSDSFAYLDIILFAAVAAFIGLRLRSVLGRKTGEEMRRPPRWETGHSQRAGAERETDSNDKVVTLPGVKREGDASDLNLSAEVEAGIEDIRANDSYFDARQFVQGAKAAFGMILEAFARGDRSVLSPLLSEDVYQSFESVISEREASQLSASTDILDLKTPRIVQAAMVGAQARITVRFESEQKTVVTSANGDVVEGNPDLSEHVIDLWTFERDTATDDPNWKLVETRAP